MKKLFITFLFLMLTASVWAADYTVQKLPNGQTIIIYPIKNNPIVTIDTWIKTGSINETDTNNGVAHFLEHLFFKGTKAHPTGEFEKILESKGAYVNAATSKDFTHYYITIPSEHFDTAIELHSDMLLNPQIPRKELEKERKVVIEEISKDGNTPSKQVFENLNTMMYTHHPYKRKVIGSADIISTIRREEILDFFNTYYIPSNMVTLVVGNVEPEAAIAKIQNSFNQDLKKPIKKSYKKEAPLQKQLRKTEYMNDAQSGYLMIGFRGANITDKDTFALDVLAEILGGNKSSRLYRNIKEQKTLAFSISASNSSYKDDGIVYISANFTPSNLEKLEKSIFEEMNNIIKYGITDEELKRAKNVIEQDTYYSRESTSNIANELGYIMALTDNSIFYDTYVENIKKVSAQDVLNAARKYLDKNKCAISIILPPQNEITPKKDETKHTAEKISENNGTIKYKVDNGTTLLVNQNKNNDIIAMSIIAKGGEFIEKIPGQGTLTAETILKGTKSFSAQELAQILDENGIIIEPECGEDFFVINIQTTTSQINKTMEILNEIVNYATFNDYEIEKKRSEILNRIKQKRDVPMNIAYENFKTIIFENSVYSQSNKVIEQNLPSVQKEDILKYYNQIFDAKNIIISISGNVDKDKIITDIGNIFQNKNYPIINYSNFKITKATAPKTVYQEIKDLQTAWLFLGWQAAGVQNKKDFVNLKIISTILGSGMSSRLFRNLREEAGLAYQLGSSYSSKMLGGIFMTYIGTNPDNLADSRQRITHEIERLKLEFVSDNELKDAKDRLKGIFTIAMETNSEKASNIALFEAYGFGYDFLNEYIKMIDEVTASDINSTANRYFNCNVIQSDVRKK